MTVIRGSWSRGTRAETTMKQMAANVRKSLGDPSVWETAHAIADGLAQRDEVGQARAIRKWVDARFKFVKDPIGDELLESPTYMLRDIATKGHADGDCDEAASLTAALGMAIGIPAQFVALDFAIDGPGYDHVYTVLAPNSPKGHVPIEMDITRPKGIPTPDVAHTLTVNV